MGRKFVYLAFILSLFVCSGCVNLNHNVNTKVVHVGENGLRIKLPFSKFPKKYTCEGEDISPPIQIQGVSKKAVTLAIIMVDIDAPSGNFVHWVIWNIPANVSYIPPGIPNKPVITTPFRACQGLNDFRKVGYGGPCPPYGVHRYVINVYSLDCKLSVPPGSSADEVLRAMRGHIIQHAEVIVKYGK